MDQQFIAQIAKCGRINLNGARLTIESLNYILAALAISRNLCIENVGPGTSALELGAELAAIAKPQEVVQA